MLCDMRHCTHTHTHTYNSQTHTHTQHTDKSVPFTALVVPCRPQSRSSRRFVVLFVFDILSTHLATQHTANTRPGATLRLLRFGGRTSRAMDVTSTHNNQPFSLPNETLSDVVYHSTLHDFSFFFVDCYVSVCCCCCSAFPLRTPRLRRPSWTRSVSTLSCHRRTKTGSQMVFQWTSGE